MMEIKLFTMQIIPLALSFGIAYWILITAHTQEGNLKSLGKTLGWSLITISIISTLFSYYLINNSRNSDDLKYPPMYSHHGDMKPMMDNRKHDNDEMEKSEQKGHEQKEEDEYTLLNPAKNVHKDAALKK